MGRFILRECAKSVNLVHFLSMQLKENVIKHVFLFQYVKDLIKLSLQQIIGEKMPTQHMY